MFYDIKYIKNIAHLSNLRLHRILIKHRYMHILHGLIS